MAGKTMVAAPLLLPLQHRRHQLHTILATEREELIGIVTEILIRVIESAIPEAKTVTFGASPTREHWAEALLTLDTIKDADDNEIPWQQLLSITDLELINELQVDLTESYAIPLDQVGLTITIE